MEENMEEIQAKQTLLQTEIIDKNYDKTAFISFCLSKKENGDDLNNWTLDELRQIVSEFVSSQTEIRTTTRSRAIFPTSRRPTTGNKKGRYRKNGKI